MVQTTNSATDYAGNPLVYPRSLPYGAPQLDGILPEHIEPAIRWGIEQNNIAIALIRDDANPATFENTIEPLEFADTDLKRIFRIVSVIADCNGTEAIRELQEKVVSRAVAKQKDNILLDSELFARIKTVYDARDTLRLNPEQNELLSDAYNRFVLGGALLEPSLKKRLRQINEELSGLEGSFYKNTLDAYGAYQRYVTDEAELDGVPERAKDMYRKRATETDPGKGEFLIEAHSCGDIAARCTNRELREEIYIAFETICCGGDYDNTDNIIQITRLRDEKAKLFVYPNYAEFALSQCIAGNVETVVNFLEKNLVVYKAAAEREMQEIKAFALAEDGLPPEEFRPWDVTFYMQKLREKKFKINMEDLQDYFELERVLKGTSLHFERLFQDRLREAPRGKYSTVHPDVKTYEVFDRDGKVTGLLQADYYARPGSKQNIAKARAFRCHSIRNGVEEIPCVTITFNFPQPNPEKPTLLSLGQVQNIFHEFGHGWNFLAAISQYPSLSDIASEEKDWLEVAAKVQEKWARQKVTLKTMAVHYQTGEALPQDLLDKVQDMENFGVGINGLFNTFAGLLDIAFHTTDPDKMGSPADIEASVKQRTSILEGEVGMLSASLGHIFGGGPYAGVLSSYDFAEFMAADIFAAFPKNKPYDRKTAKKLKETIYAPVGTQTGMQQFIAMMGRPPDLTVLWDNQELLSQTTGNKAAAPSNGLPQP